MQFFQHAHDFYSVSSSKSCCMDSFKLVYDESNYPFFCEALSFFCLSKPVELVARFLSWSANILISPMANKELKRMITIFKGKCIYWGISIPDRYLMISFISRMSKTLQAMTSANPNMSMSKNNVNLPTLWAPTQLFIHGQWWSYLYTHLWQM